MMRFLKLVACCSIWCISSFAQRTIIEGRFISKQRDLRLEDLSAFQYLKPQQADRQVKIDSSGKFSMATNLARPGYFRIGRNILYLMPGDHLEVVIDHQNPLASLFKGTGAEANRYLKETPFPKGGSFLASGQLIAADPAKTLAEIAAEAAKRLQQIDTLKNVSIAFKMLERARVKADLVNSIISTRYYAARKLKLNPDAAKAYLNTFENLSADLLKQQWSHLQDPKLLDLVVYRDILPVLLAKSDRKKLARQTDWLRADSLVSIMKGLSSKAQVLDFAKQLAEIQSPDYRQAALATRLDLLKYGKGDMAIDFPAVDLQGNIVRLSQFKGKVIYLDLWATWCGPCLAEMPAFEKLKTRFGQDDRVVFISLSIDEDQNQWMQNVRARKAGGLQWHVPRSTLKDYQIGNIPRTIIIGDDFNIADFQAPLPSDPATIPSIEKLLPTEQNAFLINGTVAQYHANQTLFLSYRGADGKMIRDSSNLEHGQFQFKGKVDHLQQAQLVLSPTRAYAIKKNTDQTTLYLGEGPIQIMAKDSIATSLITGGKNNLANQDYKAQMQPLEKARMSILYAMTPENRANPVFIDSVKRLNTSLVQQQQALQVASIGKYSELLLGLDILKAYAGPIIDISKVMPLYQNLSNAVKKTVAGNAYEKLLEKLQTTAVGVQAPKFELPDTQGNRVKLNDFKGKYVLIDFWASWCAPCRAENPNLLKVYQRYKNSGFTVLGVSLDLVKSKEAWLSAIEKDGLVWTNVSDLMGFDGPVAKQYDIQAIPQNVLVDPTGRIIGKNLRGEELEKVVSDLMK